MTRRRLPSIRFRSRAICGYSSGIGCSARAGGNGVATHTGGAGGNNQGGAAVALLLVHCRAGVSRSTAAAALILMQANPEWPASAALDAVAAIRPRAWPNLLILEFGDALLGRNGEIVAAA